MTGDTIPIPCTEASRYSLRHILGASAAATALILSGCASRPSEAERLPAAQQEMKAHILGQLAHDTCKIDEIHTCSIGKFRQNYRSTGADSLILDTDEGTITLRTSSFTNDGARHSHDASITYAVPAQEQTSGRLTVTQLTDILKGRAPQALECRSTTPSASSRVALRFNEAGEPVPSADDHLLSQAVECLNQARTTALDDGQ